MILFSLSLTRHDKELQDAMQALGNGAKSERDINVLMRHHTHEKEESERQWSRELSQLQESQRKEYREWVTKLHEDMVASGGKGQWGPHYITIGQ